VAAYNESDVVRRARAHGRANESPIAVDALCAALYELLARDAVIVADAVTSSLDLLELTLAGTERTCYTTAGGSLGWGMGAAVGVALAQPGRRIQSVIGDGVFQFGLQALFTATQLRLPITTIVIDNRSYAAVKAAVKRYRSGEVPESYVASDLAGIDIATIARGFGAHATTVSELRDLGPALAEADAQPGPSVVVVRTDPHHTGP
jgi:thiamine pyrophosphate-dependent acetolactate synthase large subunit-like protein